MGALSRKVLLIKPDYNFCSIGMAYVAAGLRRRGIDFDWFDACHDSYLELEGMVRRNDYLAVATGGLIGSFSFFRRLLASLKAARPGLPCILGGNINSALKPAQVLGFFPFDYLVLGEGELTLPELLEALDRGERAPMDIPGLAFRSPEDPARVIRTAPRPRLDLCQENWMPHWDAQSIGRYNIRAFPILTGRGCTGHCTFCAPTNGRFRGRPIPHILEEIERLNASFDFDAFNFLNEILFADEADIELFCDEYQRLGIRKRWNCLLRIDLDPKIIGRMKEAGLCVVNIGVESGSDRVLKRIKKEITVAQTEAFVRMMNKHDIFIEGSFMMAHLDERPEDLEATVSLLNRLDVRGPYALTINYPGTYNYRVAKERGLVPDEEKYITSLDTLYGVDPYDIISRHRAGELHYLNLSSMPDDELFKSVERASRRYFTENAKFQVRDPRIEATGTPGLDHLEGECPFCGKTLDMTFDRQRFALSALRFPDCPGCGVTEFHFDPRHIPEFQRHSAANRERIEGAARIALLGQSSDVRWLLRHDCFHLDPDRIAGIIACDGFPDRYALNHPVLPLDTLVANGLDLVLVLNEIPEETLQAGLLEKVGWDRIRFLTPSAGAEAMADHPPTAEALARVRTRRAAAGADPVNPEFLRERVAQFLEEWGPSQARIVIHGAGGHTAHLFDWTGIKQANVVGISDNSLSLRGIQRFGFKILAPWEIASLKPQVVLISSHAFQEEIRKSLGFLVEQGVQLVGCYQRE